MLRARFAAAAPVAALAGVAAAVLAALASRSTDWGVMTDELLYAELARGAPLPAARGEHVEFLAVLHPILVAPAYALLDAPGAYRAALAVNAVLIASTCVPAYLLARAVLPRRWAWTAALLSVATPWAVLAAYLVAESAAYPVAAWALLAFHRALVAPSARRDAVALAALVLAFLARTQLAALAVALPVAIVVYGGLSGLLRHRLVLAAYAGLGLVVAAAAATGDAGRLLGRYEVTVRKGALLPRDTPRSALLHLDQLALGLGMATFVTAVAWMLWRARSGSPAERALAAVALASGAALSVQAGSFALRFGEGVVRDRYVFYLVPLAAACGLAYLRSPPRAAWPPLAVAAVVAVSLLWHRFPEREGVYVDSPGSLLNNALRAAGDPRAAAAAATVGIAHATAVALRRRRGALVAGAAAAFGIASAVYAFGALLAAPGGSGRPKTGAPAADWVDRAASGPVAFAPYPLGGWAESAVAWWSLELWNHRLEASVGGWTYADLPVRPLALDWGSGQVSGLPGHLVRASHDARFAPAGTTVARRGALELVRLDRPARAAWATRGLDADGWLRRGGSATVRVYTRRAVLLRIALTLRAPPTGAAYTAGRRIAPGRSAAVHLTRCVRPPALDLVLTGGGGGRIDPPARGPVVAGPPRPVLLRLERVSIRPARPASPRARQPAASGTCGA